MPLTSLKSVCHIKNVLFVKSEYSNFGRVRTPYFSCNEDIFTVLALASSKDISKLPSRPELMLKGFPTYVTSRLEQ